MFMKKCAGFFDGSELEGIVIPPASSGRGMAREIFTEGGNGMIGKKAFGLIFVLALLVALALPASAAEKTFQLHIPGCTA